MTLLLVSVFGLHSLVLADNVIAPVRVAASSNVASDDSDSPWHVDTLRLGAVHYDSGKGSNGPYGLLGFRNRVIGCVPGAGHELTDGQFPGHESYAIETPELSKPQGMWLSAKRDNQEAWVELELSEETDLGQIWIWNWNDAPEIGRRVKQATIQTSTKTTKADQLGNVAYDVSHATVEFPDIGRV